MDKKRILIVEDELLIAEETKSMLIDLGYEVAGNAMNLVSAAELIENIPFDIALVDLMLGNKKDGIEVARILKSKKIPFIITSSYSDKETLEEIKTLMPSGYIVKPLLERDLFAAIEIIPVTKQEDFIKHLGDSMFYKDKDLHIRVVFNDIEFIKADGNYVEVYSNKKKHLLRVTLEDLIEKLPDNFIRVHRSFVINCKKIDAINSIHIKIGEHEVPLSKTYKDDLIKKIQSL